MKKILIVLPILLVFLGFGCTPKELPKPNIKKGADLISFKTEISGSAYPKSKILVFVNGDYMVDDTSDKEGNFKIPLTFQKEGLKEIKIKQVYKEIESEFSDIVTTTVDLTPPSTDIQIKSTIPEITTEDSIIIKAQVGDTDAFILINQNKFPTDKNSYFEKKIPLAEGGNKIKIYLEDEVGNKTNVIKEYSILVDTTPPKLSTDFCSMLFNKEVQLNPTEEFVCVDIGTWQGYLDSYNNVPITGRKKGDIKYINIDGKNIKWDENEDIYQRINLLIYGGLNKYKVVVEDIAGNQTTSYVETTAERTQENINLNLNQ